ncbi:MAG: hypothetical protein CME06_11260 [Gemmatimonadetes bacterium]|nr:hypothetical protein [Gemmatimonadota bacterium]
MSKHPTRLGSAVQIALLLLAIGFAIEGVVLRARQEATESRASIRGALARGAPATAGEVWIYPAIDADQPFPGGPPLARAPIDAEGRFRVDGIPAGVGLWVAALVDRDGSSDPTSGDLFGPAREPIRPRAGWTVDLRLMPVPITECETFVETWRIACVGLRESIQRRPGEAPVAASAEPGADAEPVFDFEATQFSPRELLRVAGPQAAWALALALLLLAGALAWHGRTLRAASAAENDTAKPPPIADHHDLTIIALLCALGAALRLIGLSHESFELNEFTYLIAGLDPHDFWHTLLETAGSAQWHAPLWRLLLKYTIAPFGLDEAISRLPGALSGTLAVPFTYLLGIRLFDRRAAAAASAAVAISPVAVYYAQDVSPYGLLTALGPASLWLLAEMRRRRGALAWAIANGACLGLAGATHYYGVHLISCQIAFAFVWTARDCSPADRTRFLASLALSLAVAALMLMPVAGLLWISSGQATDLSLAYQQRVGTYFADWDYAGAALYLFSTALGTGIDDWAIIWIALPVAALPLLCFRPCRGSVLLGICILYAAATETVLTATARAELYGGHYVAVRYWLHFVPLLLLFIWGGLLSGTGKGAAGAPRGRLAGIRLIAALLLGAATLTAFVSQQRRLDKTDLRGAARHILANAANADAIVVTPAAYFALPLQPYLAPESIADGSGLTQTPMWRSLERPSGPDRVLLWEPVTDLMGSYRSVVESHFVGDVWVVDARPLLFGRPEFSFARADSAISDLLAAFEETESIELEGGVRVHHLRGARARAGIPGTEGESWSLRLGEGDGAFIRGFAPPSHIVQEGRLVPPGAEIRIPWSGTRPGALGLELGHAGASGTAPPYEILFDGEPVGRIRPGRRWNRVVFALERSDPATGGRFVSIELRPVFEEAPRARGLAVLRAVALNPGEEWQKMDAQLEGSRK